MVTTSCSLCAGMGRKKSPRCAACHFCTEHAGCRCRKCAMCRKPVPPKELCPKCNACRTHHVGPHSFSLDFPMRKCNLMPVSCSTLEGHPCAMPKRCDACGMCKEHMVCKCSKFRVNPLRRSLGVELELAEWNGLERVKPSLKHLTFTVDHDGSVKPSERELVTGVLHGDKGLLALAELASSVKHYSSTVNETCGMHVHVDAVEASPKDLRKILVGYAAIQDQLYGSLVDVKRMTNVYCPPIALDPHQLSDLMQFDDNADISNWFYFYLYRISYPRHAVSKAERARIHADIKARLDSLKKHKYENAARRHALNFHSWMMRGTVEFRLKEGTVDQEDLMFWPQWCGWFVEKVSVMPDKELSYWLKNPPDLVSLARDWSQPGANSMPSAVAQWVSNRVSGGKRVKFIKPPAPQLQYVEEVGPGLQLFEDPLPPPPRAGAAAMNQFYAQEVFIANGIAGQAQQVPANMNRPNAPWAGGAPQADWGQRAVQGGRIAGRAARYAAGNNPRAQAEPEAEGGEE